MRSPRIALHISCIAFIVLLMPASLRASTLFQPVHTYLSGGNGSAGARSIVAVDVNGDGKPDVLVGNGDGTVGVLLGNGDGTFQSVKITDSGLVFPSSIAVEDLNGDGKPDLVVSSGASCFPSCTQLISVLLGKGDGTFGSPQLYTSGGLQANSISVADVNGDGKPDLVVANQSCSDVCNNSDGVVGVLLGKGDGTFEAALTYDSGDRTLESLAVADINGDGKLDVVVVHESGSVGVLLGNGDGTFQAAQIYGAGGALAYSIAVADVNGDSKPDLLVSNEQNACAHSAVGVLLGNGDGTFQPAVNYCTGAAGADSVAVADVNGDGNPDLLVAHTCGKSSCNSSPVAVLLGNGDGTFKSALRYYSGGWNAYSITVADLNGDSKPDALVANQCVSYSDCTSGDVGALLGTAGVKTTTKLSSSLNPSVYGEAVTLTATVTSVGSSTPTGTVSFENGTTALGTATLSGGIAVLTKTTLPAGVLSITATYKGDSDSAKSTSAPLKQTVEKAQSTTTITSSMNPSAQGQKVTFTAKVTSPTAHVTGTVTFTANGATLGTITLSGGKASFTTSALPEGSNQKIIGVYNGTDDIAESSASLLQTVN